jgi:hypothetical protein
MKKDFVLENLNFKILREIFSFIKSKIVDKDFIKKKKSRKI